MFKRSCDNCKKSVNKDSVSVDLRFESSGKYGRYDFCVNCIKSISGFVAMVMKDIKRKAK